jgi:DNA topoisomerase VI subunit B
MTTSSLPFERKTFATSRLLEFFDHRELQMQMGCESCLWPLAITKELIDNGLDAAETAGVPPIISVTVESDRVTVTDNGPGLPAKIIEQSLDYFVRVSDKSKYVSPTRGQQGNALKCLWAIPFVMKTDGYVEIRTQGQRHSIRVDVDAIAQKPQIRHRCTDCESGIGQIGTSMTLHLPQIAKLSD